MMNHHCVLSHVLLATRSTTHARASLLYAIDLYNFIVALNLKYDLVLLYFMTHKHVVYKQVLSMTETGKLCLVIGRHKCLSVKEVICFEMNNSSYLATIKHLIYVQWDLRTELISVKQ